MISSILFPDQLAEGHTCNDKRQNLGANSGIYTSLLQHFIQAFQAAPDCPNAHPSTGVGLLREDSYVPTISFQRNWK